MRPLQNRNTGAKAVSEGLLAQVRDRISQAQGKEGTQEGNPQDAGGGKDQEPTIEGSTI